MFNFLRFRSHARDRFGPADGRPSPDGPADAQRGTDTSVSRGDARRATLDGRANGHKRNTLARPRYSVVPAGDRNVAVSTRRRRNRCRDVRGFPSYFLNAVRTRHSASSSDRYYDFRAPPRSATCLLAGNGPNRSRTGREIFFRNDPNRIIGYSEDL